MIFQPKKKKKKGKRRDFLQTPKNQAILCRPPKQTKLSDLLAVSVGVVEDCDQLSMTLSLLSGLHHLHPWLCRHHPGFGIFLAGANAGRPLQLPLNRGRPRFAVRRATLVGATPTACSVLSDCYESNRHITDSRLSAG